MDKVAPKEGDERTKTTYRVAFEYVVHDIPIDVGNSTDAMYAGHKQFADWLDDGVSPSQFPYTVYKVTVAEVYKNNTWQMKYQITQTLTGFDTGLALKYWYDGKKHYDVHLD